MTAISTTVKTLWLDEDISTFRRRNNFRIKECHDVHRAVHNCGAESFPRGGRRDVEAHCLAGADVIVLNLARLTALRAHI